MRLSLRYVLILAALAFLAGGVAQAAQGASAASPLVGAWAVEAAASAQGESFGDPTQRGLYIFTPGGHYSAVYSTASRPRAAADFNPTDEEKAGQYDTIIVNTGTYEVSASVVTMKPTIAKSAEFVGGSAVADFEVDGDTLTLTAKGTTSAGGTKLPGGGSLTLRRLE